MQGAQSITLLLTFRACTPVIYMNLLIGLKGLTASELQKLILRVSKNNTDFEKAVLQELEAKRGDKYSPSGVASMIKAAVRKYKRYNFIDPYKARQLAADIEQILAAGDRALAHKDYLTTYQIGTASLNELIKCFDFTDDSSGMLGECTAHAINLLTSLVIPEDVARDLKEKLYDFLTKAVLDNVYYRVADFGYHLHKLLGSLALLLRKSDDYLSLLERELAKPTADEGHVYQEFLVVQQTKMLQALGRKDQAKQLQQKNIEHPDVREQLIENALENKDYSTAKTLAEDGINLAEKLQHPGTVTRWQKWLLQIAVAEKDLETIRLYAQQFTFDYEFDIEHYNLWKSTYPAKEWARVIEKWISDHLPNVEAQLATLEPGRNDRYSRYMPYLIGIYALENRFDDLLSLAQKQRTLTGLSLFHKLLAKRYPEQMAEAYIPLLESEAKVLNDRNAYRKLVRFMQKLLKDLPSIKPGLLLMVERLRKTYSYRPAMLDELKVIR